MTKKGSPARSPSSRGRTPDPFALEFPGGSRSANAAVLSLIRTEDAVMTLLNGALRHHGISAGGRQTLAVLDGAGTPLSPSAIAERLLVTTASMTSLLDTLERRGLVVREPDPNDRRGLLVSLTDEGQELVNRFLPEVIALQTALMAGISESDREALQAVLGRIRESVKAVDAAAVVAAAPARVPPVRS